MELNQNFIQKPSRYIGDIRKKDFYNHYIEKIKQLNILNVLELGCATGDFLYHLPSTVRGVGVDVSEELIEVAKKTRTRNNLEFVCEDVFKYNPKIKPELVVMTGFMCTFFDFEKLLEKALSLSSKYIFINDFINDHDLDCKYSFREVGDADFQTVYNIWSKKTLISFLSKKNIKYEIEPYHINTELKENINPTYNYHSIMNGRKILMNNGGVILNGCNIYIEIN
jgi:SAM-dependent methyltransferase